MTTRRDFIRKSIFLSGAAGLSTMLPPAIERALAIDPAPGSTYLDAEHVVILMQENRSFDHCFGTLQGVRGFNDPRAFRLPGGNPVWMQTDAKQNTYLPFRLGLKDTKATWMGALPHSRTSQVDAHHNGYYDHWLRASHLRDKRYAEIPFTLGYYNREDLPFNYALADAFTICDQHFSSAMTSTWPNRHYMWSGNIRSRAHAADARAHIRNDLDVGEAKWTTYPERLEAQNISWRIYQNDLTSGGGYQGEERSWLSNFTCNTLEFFDQYNVRFSARYAMGLKERETKLQKEISDLEEQLKRALYTPEAHKKVLKNLEKKKEVLQGTLKEINTYTQEHFQALSPREKNLYRKAFTINEGDRYYQQLEPFIYKEDGQQRSLQLPKGDVLHQFRKDVKARTLPTVSWLVSPQMFSDHPSAPWYGTWMVSEILNILTLDPEVWKKTIFILTYDENDGYFDHVPPFMPPNPDQVQGGKCSEGIDTQVEYIPLEQELHYGVSKKAARGGQIGLGYRVPLIVASPWSRGGRVNSQVFDHTSSLQFLERFLEDKFGKAIQEANMSAWRRTVCGDLRSVFTRFQPQGMAKEALLTRERVVRDIHTAQFKQAPEDYRALTAGEMKQGQHNPQALQQMPRQEPGTRPSCALPYELYVNGQLSTDGQQFVIRFQASDAQFGADAAGAPFTVYTRSPYRPDLNDVNYDPFHIRRYAVAPGDTLSDTWNLRDFKGSSYHLQVNGPNGFFREFKGAMGEAIPTVTCTYALKNGKRKLNGNLILKVKAPLEQACRLQIRNAYRPEEPISVDLKAGEEQPLNIALSGSQGWYDLQIRMAGSETFLQAFAGKVETGEEGISDPIMGRSM